MLVTLKNICNKSYSPLLTTSEAFSTKKPYGGLTFFVSYASEDAGMHLHINGSDFSGDSYNELAVLVSTDPSVLSVYIKSNGIEIVTEEGFYIPANYIYSSTTGCLIVKEMPGIQLMTPSIKVLAYPSLNNQDQYTCSTNGGLVQYTIKEQYRDNSCNFDLVVDSSYTTILHHLDHFDDGYYVKIIIQSSTTVEELADYVTNNSDINPVISVTYTSPVEIPETISTVFQKNSSEYNLVFWGFDSKLNKWFSFDSTVSSSDIIKIIQCSNYDWVYVQLKYAPDFVNINITYEVEDV